MSWKVVISKRVQKEINALPDSVRFKLEALTLEISLSGPVRGNWPNYSKLGEGKHHCHLKKGHPTFVACWRVVEKTIQLVEVYYAGTHEKAPY